MKLNDIDFNAGTIRVDESADQRTYKIGPCKNATAYRTVLLADSEGRASVVGSKAANGGQVKTGQRMWPGTWFFYPIFS